MIGWEVKIMTNKENEKENNWTNRDWFWLLGILIGIIILLIASIFAKSLKIETNFSIISSAVSIALALVAIFFALKQDSDNRRVNDNVSGILNNIVSEMLVVKNSVEKITGKDIDTIAQETLEEISNVNKQTSYTAEEVEEIVQKAISNFGENVKTKVSDSENNSNLYESISSYKKMQKLIQDIVNENNKEFKNIAYIQTELRNRHGIELSKIEISRIMRLNI